MIPLPEASITVAQLIRSKIASEWASSGAAGIESADPGTPVSPWLSEQEAIRHSIDAYRAGWYIVIVDGTQPSGLDSAIDLCAESRVVFARLHPVREGLL